MITYINNNTDLIVNNVFLLDNNNNIIEDTSVSSYTLVLYTLSSPPASYQTLTSTQLDTNENKLYINAEQLSKLAAGQLYLRETINIADVLFSDSQNNIVHDIPLDFCISSIYARDSSYIDAFFARLYDLSTNVYSRAYLDTSINNISLDISSNTLLINDLSTNYADISTKIADITNQIGDISTKIDEVNTTLTSI